MSKQNLSKTMRKAWELAREGARSFGGNAKLYFACALKLTWQEEKKVATAEETPEAVRYRGCGYRYVLPGCHIRREVATAGKPKTEALPLFGWM